MSQMANEYVPKDLANEVADELYKTIDLVFEYGDEFMKEKMREVIKQNLTKYRNQLSVASSDAVRFKNEGVGDIDEINERIHYLTRVVYGVYGTLSQF